MDKGKILGQLNLSGGPSAISLLYQVPINADVRAEAVISHTIISSIVVTETAGAAATYSIWVQPQVDVASTSAVQLLASTASLAASKYDIINPGIILPGEPEITAGVPSGKTAGLVVRADTGSVTFQLFGIEVGR